jgi:hypothetical protein
MELCAIPGNILTVNVHGKENCLEKYPRQTKQTRKASSVLAILSRPLRGQAGLACVPSPPHVQAYHSSQQPPFYFWRKHHKNGHPAHDPCFTPAWIASTNLEKRLTPSIISCYNKVSDTNITPNIKHEDFGTWLHSTTRCFATNKKD